MKTRMFTAGTVDATPAAVEVMCWEIHFSRNTAILETLMAYCLDSGPVRPRDSGEIIFRFPKFDWDKTLRNLLSHHHIPHIIASTGTFHWKDAFRKRIFVADDDADILIALSHLLENAGYLVLASPMGRPVLDTPASRIDLFILDRQMPDINGLDICRELRGRAATCDKPVILVSAHPQTGHEALLAGATDYLEKPFHMHYLLNLVGRYTGGKSNSHMALH